MVCQLREPLTPLSDWDVRAWAVHVVGLVPIDVDTASRVPSLSAPTVEVAVDVLLFLIQWNFEHLGDAPGPAQTSAFEAVFAQRFPNELEVELTYVSLHDLCRRICMLDLTMYACSSVVLLSCPAHASPVVRTIL